MLLSKGYEVMCEFDYDDYENPSVWNQKIVKARKCHKCNCCGVNISPKETYLKHFSVYDGLASSERMCIQCYNLMLEFSKAHAGFMWSPIDFPYALRECLSEAGDKGDERWREMLKEIRERKEL